jgi:osmotically-inducible protein OsmY
MSGLWRSLPIGRATAATWAWKNRRELGRWAGFVWRAVPPSSAGRDDMLTEARLRAALAKDRRTRGVPSLAVRVADGTAFLQGRVSPDLHDLAALIAQKTKGVRRVECRIEDKGRRRTPTAHGHTIPLSAIPPMPG